MSEASWRRSADSLVHVYIERAGLARCGVRADELGERLKEADQDLCDNCAFAVLHDATDAEDSLAQLRIDRARASADVVERLYKVALSTLRVLIATAPPSDQTPEPLTEAERVLQLGDADQALDLVRQWRTGFYPKGPL